MTESYSVISAESKRTDPSIAVETISTISTITPKNSENHRAPRKTSDPTLRSLLLPVAMALGDVAGGDRVRAAHQ